MKELKQHEDKYLHLPKRFFNQLLWSLVGWYCAFSVIWNLDNPSTWSIMGLVIVIGSLILSPIFIHVGLNSEE